MIHLPNELIDKILLYTNDIHLAITLKRTYVIKKLFNPKIHTWENASSNGHLDIIKWARGNGLCVRPKDMSICDNAIKGNHFEIFEWIKKNGFACNHITCKYAARTSNLKLLIYLLYSNQMKKLFHYYLILMNGHNHLKMKFDEYLTKLGFFVVLIYQYY